MVKVNSQKPELSDIDNSNTLDDSSQRKFWSKKDITLSRLKRKIFKHVWFVRVMLIGLAIAFLALVTVATGSFVRFAKVGYYFSFLKNFVFAPQSAVKSFEGRTNILILGKSGVGEAPDLTDTIIFASLSYTKPSVVLVSIPRDIWIPEIRAKINSAYYWGNERQEKGGLILAKSLVEEITGQPIQYGVVVDFSGFKKVIDALGGIEVNVDRSFTDTKYPIPGKENDLCGGDKEFKCRYETVTFQKGKQFMDGETALKFVRSRHSEDPEEGTDIARDARQQKVISAIKEKILSRETYLSPKKMLAVYQAVKESLETDMEESAQIVTAKRLFDAKNKMKSFVLPNDFLVNPPISGRYDFQYVFIPKEGNWDKIHEWIKSILQ